GVLLDMARFKGVDAMRPGEAIYVEDLEACAAKQRVTVEPGDIVLIRTGDVGRRVREKSWGTFSAGDAPGLSFHTAPWLYGKSIAGIATDTWVADVLDLAEEADRLGYDSVKIVEHYFTSYGGYSPDPCVFLAACSQRTRRLRMVTGAVLPVFNHPLKLAGQLTMLDAISGGRLDAGFAR